MTWKRAPPVEERAPPGRGSGWGWGERRRDPLRPAGTPAGPRRRRDPVPASPESRPDFPAAAPRSGGKTRTRIHQSGGTAGSREGRGLRGRVPRDTPPPPPTRGRAGARAAPSPTAGRTPLSSAAPSSAGPEPSVGCHPRGRARGPPQTHPPPGKGVRRRGGGAEQSWGRAEGWAAQGTLRRGGSTQNGAAHACRRARPPPRRSPPPPPQPSDSRRWQGAGPAPSGWKLGPAAAQGLRD